MHRVITCGQVPPSRPHQARSDRQHLTSRNEDDPGADQREAENQALAEDRGPGGTGTLTDVTSIVTGQDHTCAIRTGASVWCWGRNDRGQLGNATTTASSTPVQVRGPGGTGTLSGASRIAAGDNHTCVVGTGASAWCWGRNDRGQLGNATTTDSSSPVQVRGPGGSGTFTGAVRVGAGDRFTCAGRSDATVWCWGNNNRGQLGNNTTANSSTPVQVIGF